MSFTACEKEARVTMAAQSVECSENEIFPPNSHKLFLCLPIERQMASPIGASGSFAIKIDDKGSSIPIYIAEPSGVKSENLSLSTWGASLILADHLHKVSLPFDPSTRHVRILELGAGTGLVGLAAAALWKAEVTLTDLPPIVPGLEANVALNSEALKKRGSTGLSGSLDWTYPERIVFTDSKEIAPDDGKPQVILAADVIYDEDHPELLCNTITTWLAPGQGSRAILCYPLRMAYIDHIRNFWERMEAAGLECCDEGKEVGEENWNEVAHTPYEWCIWRWKKD